MTLKDMLIEKYGEELYEKMLKINVESNSKIEKIREEK
jgi:hypothetical protein